MLLRRWNYTLDPLNRVVGQCRQGSILSMDAGITITVFSLRSIFKTSAETERAHSLYAETILAARRPLFFNAGGVPDTAEGRFEMIALIAFLVLQRLKMIEGTNELSQKYFDIMFDDIDSNLRELGVGDISVGKKVKKLAESFYGRIKAYEGSLEADDNELLTAALMRNVYRNTDVAHETAAKLSVYVRDEVSHLNELEDQVFLDGKISFIDPSQAFGVTS